MHIFKIKHQSKQLIKVESVVQAIVHSTYMVQMQLLPWRGARADCVLLTIVSYDLSVTWMTPSPSGWKPNCAMTPSCISVQSGNTSCW